MTHEEQSAARRFFGAARADQQEPDPRWKSRSKTTRAQAAVLKVVIAGASATESRRLVSIVCATGDAWIVALAKRDADAIRTVLDEEPDVLIIGSRLEAKQGLALLHAVRPLLPELRTVAVGDRPCNEFRRAFLLGDIDLLLSGSDRMEVIPEVLQEWQRERRHEPCAAFVAAAFGRSPEG